MVGRVVVVVVIGGEGLMDERVFGDIIVDDVSVFRVVDLSVG